MKKLNLSSEWEIQASGGARQDRNKSILLNTRYNWKLVFIQDPQNTEGKGFLTPLSGSGNRKMDKKTCLSHTRVASFPKLVFIFFFINSTTLPFFSFFFFPKTCLY